MPNDSGSVFINQWLTMARSYTRSDTRSDLVRRRWPHGADLNRLSPVPVRGNLLGQSMPTRPSPSPPAPRLYPICEGRAWGYIDARGQVVVPPTFKSAEAFREGLGRVKGDKGFGFVDATGAVVIEPKLVEAHGFAHGLAKARRGKKYGYLGRDGGFAISPRFLQCEAFTSGLASAQDVDSKLWGVIDATGAWVIEPSDLGGAWFADGLAARQRTKDGQFGYVDEHGRFVIEPRFDLALPFAEGLAWVVEGGAPRFIDRDGRTVVADGHGEPGGPREYVGFHDGRALVRVADGRLGYLARDGAFAIPPRFRWADRFAEGRAMVGPDDDSPVTTRQGYIDREGRYVVRPVLYTAGSYEGGLARVHADPKRETVFGYLDLDGRWVWQPGHGFAAELQDLRA